jgi:hypothetical protein
VPCSTHVILTRNFNYVQLHSQYIYTLENFKFNYLHTRTHKQTTKIIDDFKTDYTECYLFRCAETRLQVFILSYYKVNYVQDRPEDENQVGG